MISNNLSILFHQFKGNFMFYKEQKISLCHQYMYIKTPLQALQYVPFYSGTRLIWSPKGNDFAALMDGIEIDRSLNRHITIEVLNNYSLL